MTTSKQINSVALFPLCDSGNVLIQALRDTSGAETTRSDALVMAWRLGLPARMNVAAAAKAILLTAYSLKRTAWTKSQVQIMVELEKHAKGSTPNERRRIAAKHVPVSRQAPKSTAPVTRRAPRRNAPMLSSGRNELKKDKDWWNLVGPGEK